MPVCSLIGCGIRNTPNEPSLTIHRIPRNEHRKKMWRGAIGMENIKLNVKDIYICSIHFDDKCFNRTLDVTRLRDDAVPFKFVRNQAQKIKNLEDKCGFLRKKVKKLNEKVRRQKKKIVEFQNIMGEAKRA